MKTEISFSTSEELRVLYVALTRPVDKLIITGTVSSVEESLISICNYVKEKLGYTVCEITKT